MNDREILLEKVDHRFNRVIGQIKAIQRSIQENPDTNCKDLVFQIKATRSALKKISDTLLEQKISQCVDINKKELIHLKEALEILAKEY